MGSFQTCWSSSDHSRAGRAAGSLEPGGWTNLFLAALTSSILVQRAAMLKRWDAMGCDELSPLQAVPPMTVMLRGLSGLGLKNGNSQGVRTKMP